jgi:6-phosphogluconolactonase
MEQCIVASDEPVIYCIQETIRSYLKNGRTLLLLSGGSAATVAVRSLEELPSKLTADLLIGQIDERYGPVGHPYSNWKHLQKQGLSPHKYSCYPILKGVGREETVSQYNAFLQEMAAKGDLPIVGIFGIGTDGHTAGILPESPAVKVKDSLLTSYEGPDFYRITVTPAFIERVNAAILYAKGEEKARVLRTLLQDEPPERVPAQLLKKAGQFTIFHNYTDHA